MIEASAATHTALQGRKLAMRVRVFWKISGSSPGIDVTDRVVQPIGSVTRALAPFLGGFGLTGTTIVLRNDDGYLTTGEDTSYLRSGPTSYNLTEISIEQGIAAGPGDSFEYFDVFTGAVEWIRYRIGEVELKVAGRLSALRNMSMPEEYSFGEYTSAGYPRTLVGVVPDLLGYSTFSTALLAGADYIFGNAVNEDLGWNCSGSVGRGASIGKALEEVCRSNLMTVAETESGYITFLSEILPRRTGGTYKSSSDTTFYFDDTNAVGWEVVPGMRTTATEVVVNYQGTSVSYRNDDDVTKYGWFPVLVQMPFVRNGAAAAWAARVIYEHHKQFPFVLTFATFGHGLLVQLNDRCQVKDPITDTVRTARVVSKTWSPGAVTIGVVVDSAQASIHDALFGVIDSTDWDDGTYGAL